MALFSSSGSVWDDTVSTFTGGVVNPGKGKDARRAAEKQNSSMRAELQALRKEGIAQGNEEFNKTYGVSKENIAGDFKNIIAARRNAVNLADSDPAVARIKQSQNDATKQATSQLAASAVKGGASAKTLHGISRNAKRDADMAQRDYYMKSLGEYQDITGNLATNSQRLPLMYGQLAMSSQYQPPAAQAPGLFGDLFSSIGIS